MNKDKIYISTTAFDTVEVACRWGLGIEIAEYCTAWNMNDEFVETDVLVRKKLEGISRRVLHAPFAQYDILYQVYILGRTLQDVAIKADRSYS